MRVFVACVEGAKRERGIGEIRRAPHSLLARIPLPLSFLAPATQASIFVALYSQTFTRLDTLYVPTINTATSDVQLQLCNKL